jgi:hypothetical protein
MAAFGATSFAAGGAPSFGGGWGATTAHSALHWGAPPRQQPAPVHNQQPVAAARTQGEQTAGTQGGRCRAAPFPSAARARSWRGDDSPAEGTFCA